MPRQSLRLPLVIASFRNYFLQAALAALLVVAVFIFFPSQKAAAAIDQLPFEARLTTSSGTNVADGTYSITFNLYTVATGGTAIWSETDSVTVTKGEFAVDLGAGSSLSGVNFNQSPLYLAFKVGSDPEMTPRYELGSVPSALDATNLNGLSSSAFFQKNQNETVTGNTSFTGAVNIQPAATSGDAVLVNANSSFTGNLINLEANSSTKFAVNQAGAVTAGTWQGTVISAPYGGTGISSFTAGDILYASGTTTLSKLAIGSDGLCLVSSAGAPAWGSCNGGSVITLQTAYAAGNNITTTDGRDIAFNLAHTTTDGRFIVNIASGSTGSFDVQSNGTDVLQVNSTLTRILSGGLTIDAGGLTVTAGSISLPNSSIANAALANSSLTVTAGTNLTGGGSVALGSSVTLNVTSAPTFSGLVTLSNSGATALALTGSPASSTTSSLVQLGSAIASGSSNGTYLGINPASFSGNFADFQVGGSSVFKVTSAGALSVSSTINGATLSGGTLSGGSVSGGSLSSTAVNGLSVSSGTISSGTWNGSTVGVAYGGTGATSLTSNGVLYGNGTGAVQATAAGTNGQCLIVSSGAPAWGSCAQASNTLQAAYNNGAAITTTNARDLSITLAHTTTDSNALINIATGSTGKFAVQNNGTDILSVNTTTTTIASGGLAVTGNSTITGTLGGLTGLTVASGSVSVPAGSIANAALANSSLTVTAGTNLSGGGSVALGGSTTLNVSSSPTFTGLITDSLTNGTAVSLSGAPAASATSSLVQLGGAIALGSTSGTYIGLNAATGYGGNFVDYQVNGSSKYSIASNGNVTAAGTVNGATLSGGTLSGGTVSGGSLSATAVNGLSVSGGTISSGTWNGSTIGVAYGGTGATTLTSNGVLFGNGTGAVQATAAGTNGQCLIVSSGVPAWGSCAQAADTLQAAYGNGSTITTTNANDLAITLAHTTTDSNFLVNIATSSTGKLAVQSAGSDIFRVTSSGVSILTGGIAVTGNSTITGTLGGLTGLTVASGSVSLPSGVIANGALANSSLTVTAGTNLTGGGSVALGSSVTLNVTSAPTFSGLVTLSNSGATALALTGSPASSATSSLVQLGSAIASGSLSGTYLGINPASFSGNFVDYQVNGTSKFSISSAGAVTAAGTLNGLTVSSGTVSSGTWQGGTVAVAYGGTGATTFTSNGVLYGNGTGAVQVTAAGTNGQCLVNSSGTPVWGSCSGSSPTLQSDYNAGNTITTTDARDISITLADTTTDPNFLINIAGSSTGRFAVQGGGTDILSVNTTATTVAGNFTVASGNSVGLGGAVRSDAGLTVLHTWSAATAGEQYGEYLYAQYTTADTGLKQDLRVITDYNASGTEAQLVGIFVNPRSVNASGTITSSYAVSARNDASSGGTIQNAYDFYVNNAGGTGTITNQYGLYVESLTRGSTLNYAVYTAGTTPSLFGGTVTAAGLIDTPVAATTALNVTQAASATADALQVNNSSSTLTFAVDATGKISTGTSIPGVPLVGIDPNSGGSPGNLTSSTSPFATTIVNSSTQLTIQAGSAYTANGNGTQTAELRCSWPTTTGFTAGGGISQTDYIIVTSDGSLGTSGRACNITLSATYPTFNASYPVLVIGSVVTDALGNGTWAGRKDFRFFIGGTLTYVQTAAAYQAGSIVKIDTSADNQVITTTTAADTGVAGIIVVGNTAAGTAILMTSGHTYARASNSSRASCAGTTTSAAILSNVTAAVNVCVGRLLTSGSTGSALVLVEPN